MVVNMDPTIDGATTFTDLPLAPEGRSWDGGAARSRLARWASSDGSGSKDTVDWPKYRKGFFWFDGAAPEEFGSYKLPFADALDGSAKAVFKGVSAAVQRLSGTDIPEADKAKVKSHARRYYKKFGKPFPDELSVDETEALAEDLRDAQDLSECEELRERLLDAHPNGFAEDEDCVALLQDVDEKIETLKRQDREEFHDEYHGTVEVVEALSDGRLKVRAIVAQVDRVNANKRLYPKEEMLDALKRANRSAKRGALVGLDGHPGIFESGKVSDIVVRWDAFMLKDDDLYAEGTTVLTEAGKEVTTVWQSGVALEWSIRGYGRSEPVEKEDGTWTHDIIHDYVLDGVDVVLRGAAKTQTLSLSVESADKVAESQSRPPEPEAETQSTTMHEDQTPKTDAVEEPTPAPTPSPVEPTPPPGIDEGALTARLLEGIMPSVAEATTKAAEAAFSAKALADYKGSLLTVIADEEVRKPLERALAGAKTVEEAQAIHDEMEPVIRRAMRPETEFNGFGIVTSDTRELNHREKLVLDGKVLDRPRTAREAFIKLAETVEDDGRASPANKGWVWRKVLENYWNSKEFRSYFDCMTKPYLDAATSTSSIGTYMGVALPVLRQAFPMLIPFDIGAVWPLRSKQGTIPTLKYTKSTGGAQLSDSANFDSTYANQTEGSTKKQITMSLDTRNVTAIDRALYISLTTQVMFDMQAEWDIDIESEMLLQCGNELARETNFAYIEMMLAQATAGTTTFGQLPPSGSQYTGAEWIDRSLPKAVEAVAQDIRDNRYRNPDWCIAGSAVYALLKSVKTTLILPRDQIVKYGDGLSLVANLDGTTDVYLAAWLSNRSQALFGYRPNDGQFADAVAAYCPYVPMYISEPDFTASTNTRDRSVSQRDAMTVLQPTGLGVLTINTSAASADWSFE